MTKKILEATNDTINEKNVSLDEKSTEPDNSIKSQIMRKITFDNNTLRNLSTMAAHYHFDKHVKSDELLSIMLKDVVDYYYKNKFISELK